MTQAESAIETAVSDGDLTPDDANSLRELQAQSIASLAAGDLEETATKLGSACEMFRCLSGVAHPTVATFISMATSEECQEMLVHRQTGLEHQLLLEC